MDAASVAVILVSANSLTSDFILREEVEYLLRRRKEEGMSIFPVILEPCDWQGVPWLSRMQVRPRDGHPLSSGDRHQIATNLTAIVKEVRLLLNNSEQARAPQDAVTTSSAAPPPTSSVSVSTETAAVEITINRDFDSYGSEEQARLLAAIKEILEVAGDVRVIKKRRGSVKLTLKLTHEEAERLIWSVRAGELADFGVVEAEITNTSSPRRSKRFSADEENLARKEEILRVATELFAEQGFSDAITQVLADRLQLGKGTIYRHFPSKRDLFLAAADRVMRKMQEKILASIAGVEDGLEQVSRGIKAFLSFFAEHPEYVELLIQERAQFKDRKRPTYFEHREVNVVRWRKLYARLIAEGRVRDLPVERITNVVGNLIYGTMFTNYFIGQAKPVEEQAEEILDIVFRGILTEEELARMAAAEVGNVTHQAVAAPSSKARGH